MVQREKTSVVPDSGHISSLLLSWRLRLCGKRRQTAAHELMRKNVSKPCLSVVLARSSSSSFLPPNMRISPMMFRSLPKAQICLICRCLLGIIYMPAADSKKKEWI